MYIISSHDENSLFVHNLLNLGIIRRALKTVVQTQPELVIHLESDAETTKFLSRKVLPFSEVTVVYLASWASCFGQPTHPTPDTQRNKPTNSLDTDSISHFNTNDL
jgi:hypothetical protein